MRIDMHRPQLLKGRRGWVTLSVVLALGLLAIIGRWDAQRRKRPALHRVVAQAGDSVFTVARLRAWLSAQPETLSRVEVQDWLEGWVEDQILAQAALRLGLDTLGGAREELGRIRLRYLRGLLEEESLAESLSISKLELKTWFKGNSDLLAQPERQLRLDWYAGRDSLALARLSPQLARDRVPERRLEELGIRRGQTGYLPRSELSPRHADALFRLKYMQISPVLPLPGGWVLYRLAGQRPTGWLPDPDADEALVRDAMLQDLRWKRLQSRLEALREEAVWKVDITPLLETEGGVPPPRR
jgi:hypothetical protein